MTKKDITIENSYLKHIDIERSDRIKNALPSSFFNPDCINAWRHNRLRDSIIPLIDFYPNTKWITLGDGRFGSDAFYLQNKDLDVLATSISDETISVAHKLGYIHKYKKMNAEAILEEDNLFDFSFCKESYHHFPRPYIALYEMLRVSNRGVVLIEPQDNKTRLFDYFKKMIKTNLRKDSNLNFELRGGNYIYRININELSKVMTAINLRYIAYKGLNDFYIPSLSGKSMKTLNKAKIITLLGIGIQNILCKLRLMDYGLATVILFKNDVSNELLKNLSKKGFHIRKLPINPYV
jgi:SAM-dependent methyltransferase